NLSQIFILGTALSANSLFIKRIQSYNLIGFYVKPIDCERLQDKMNIICKKFKNHVSDRKYIRITPKDDDFVRAFFKLKSGKRISSKVLDISIGGLAISLYSDCETIELAEGNLLEHIIFEIDNKEIDVDAKIVKKNGLAVALQFTHFYLNSYDSLLKYIMKNLSESV
ncbi:MAG: PilZ domain-containing protein, partial [Spirochaetes bacterium]|nr:PilZ domain-containing protein [Spirochaetota bacterium]